MKTESHISLWIWWSISTKSQRSNWKENQTSEFWCCLLPTSVGCYQAGKLAKTCLISRKQFIWRESDCGKFEVAGILLTQSKVSLQTPDLTVQLFKNITNTIARQWQGLQKRWKSIKSSRRFSIGLRGISRLGSAFIFLRCFKLAHICIQVTSLRRWNKQGSNHKF